MHGKTVRDKTLETCLNESYFIFTSTGHTATALIVGQGQMTIVTSYLNEVDHWLLRSSIVQLKLTLKTTISEFCVC